MPEDPDERRRSPMMKSGTNRRLHWFVLCALAFTLGSRAPSEEWNGTWKLNASKSSVQGYFLTISISPDGEYRYDDGAVKTTFRCDGKFRPMGNNRTQNCVRSSATTLDRTRMENGVPTNTYHWELSADGTILTSTATALGSGRPVLMGRLVARRIAGSNDFAGQWRDMDFLKRRPELTLVLDGHYLHIGSANTGYHVDAPLNGADSPMIGSNAIVGMTYSVRKTRERELLILKKLNGKEFSQEALQLNEAGTAVTDSIWNPDRPTDKATLVYEKRQ